MLIKISLAFLVVSLTSCDQSPRTVPAKEPGESLTAKLPRPDAFRMNYDPTTRTLTLYELAEDARWMIVTPWHKSGEPVSLSHAFNQDQELDAVAVFYTTPSGQSSPRVTLREIVTVQVTHRK